MADTAKLKLTEPPVKGDNAWNIKIKDGITTFIPKTCIMGYIPAIKEIEIETWILIKNNIPFKLK